MIAVEPAKQGSRLDQERNGGKRKNGLLLAANSHAKTVLYKS